MTRLDRRTLLVAGGALLAGCAADPELVPGASSSGPATTAATGRPRRPGRTRTPSPAPTVTVPDGLPTPMPWAPGPGEVEPAAKLAATRVIEALGLATEGGPGPAERLREIGADPALAAAAGPLVPPSVPGLSTLVYPQYGGLTAGRASVMAVVEQTWLADPADPTSLTRRTVTADVRLSRGSAGWLVTELRPVEVAAGTTPTPAGRAGELAALPGLVLPDAARSELAAGAVDPRVVETLIGLAGQFTMSVTVFSAGHPVNVFGTRSLSNHGAGRAVDIWAVDGRPVVDLARGRGSDGVLLRGFLTAAGGGGSDEVGGPVVPPGARPGYFTNALHRDHVHIGFDA